MKARVARVPEETPVRCPRRDKTVSRVPMRDLKEAVVKVAT